MSINACTFLGSGLAPYWEIISLMKGMLLHLRRHLSLLSFRLTCLHILSTLSNVMDWSLPSSSKPAIRISSVIPNTLAILLNGSSIITWNMSLNVATSNNNPMYLYLPNGQENVNMMIPSNLRLCYPELASMGVRYLTPTILGRISFNVQSLCTGLGSALSSLAGSRHNCTLPLTFKTRTKLFHYSNILPMPHGTIISCFCSHSCSSLSGFWSTYATLLVGAWYGWLPSFACNLKVHSKHPIPEKNL